MVLRSYFENGATNFLNFRIIGGLKRKNIDCNILNCCYLSILLKLRVHAAAEVHLETIISV